MFIQVALSDYVDCLHYGLLKFIFFFVRQFHLYFCLLLMQSALPPLPCPINPTEFSIVSCPFPSLPLYFYVQAPASAEYIRKGEFTMWRCPKCGSEIPDHVDSCAFCEIKRPQPIKNYCINPICYSYKMDLSNEVKICPDCGQLTYVGKRIKDLS